MRTVTVHTIVGRVNADGTPAAGTGFTSRKTGAGAYTLTLSGRRLQALTVTGAAGTPTVTGWTTDGAAVSLGADSAFAFMAGVAA